MGEACFLEDTSLSRSEPRWYALKVRSRLEEMALTSLTYYGFEPYWAHRIARRKYADRIKSVKVPVIPGYIFCRFDLSAKSLVLSSNGVDGIVGLGGQPIPIPVHEIEGVRRTVEAGGGSASRPAAGSRVRVLGGCLAGLEGVLVREASKSHFLVSVELLHRSVSIRIDEALVETIANN